MREKNISIEVRDDRMEASAIVTGKIENLKEITDTLNECGVKCGIDLSTLRRIGSGEIEPGSRVVIAAGEPVGVGSNAEILVCYRPERESVVGHGWRIAGKIAKKNEVLAVKLRATEGHDGRDVFGNSIKGQLGLDKKFEAGRNVQARFFPDKIEYSAMCEGIVQEMDGKLEVNSLCIIEHDIDLSTGDIEFAGSLLIKGSVQRGFKVRSQGSVTIEGNVEGGDLFAEGQIEVKGSISASSTIRGGGGVIAKHIEHSLVESGGDIVVEDGILHSDLMSNGRVIVTKGRGVVVGGEVKAREGVESNQLGNAMRTRTLITLGGEHWQSKRLIQMETELKGYEDEISRVQETLKPFLTGQSLAVMPEEKQWALRSLTGRLKELRILRNQLRDKLATSDQMVQNPGIKRPQVRVRDILHPGVVIKIGQKKLELDHELSRVAIFESPVTREIVVTDVER